MKTSKEFFERLQNDESFAKEVAEAVQAKRNAGAADYYETFIPVAADHGYEISNEDLDAIFKDRNTELSEEELGKVAGGTSCTVISSIILSISGTLASATVTYVITKEV